MCSEGWCSIFLSACITDVCVISKLTVASYLTLAALSKQQTHWCRTIAFISCWRKRKQDLIFLPTSCAPWTLLNRCFKNTLQPTEPGSYLEGVKKPASFQQLERRCILISAAVLEFFRFSLATSFLAFLLFAAGVSCSPAAFVFGSSCGWSSRPRSCSCS